MRAAALTICALFLLAACDNDGVRISSTRSDDGDGKGVLKVVDALQCPQTLGILTRKGSAQGEGKICTYVGPRGAEVSLHLIALDGEPVGNILDAFETRLSRDLPAAAAATAQRRADQAATQADAAQAQADAAAVQADAAAARADAAASGDRASVHLPGLSIDAQGEKANVRIGGINIRADDSNATVDINGDDQTVNIQSHDDGAQIRTRAAGQATRTTWMLTDSRQTESEWRVVGYEARGPEGGPIVLATVRTRDRDGDAIFDAAKDLVTLNVGE